MPSGITSQAGRPTLNEKPYKSVGMSITKERLASIGKSSSINIEDLKCDKGDSIGTRVEVVIDNNN